MNVKYFLRTLNCPFDLLVDLIPNNAKILDLGCGEAYLYKYHLNKKKILQYTGIDISLKNKLINLQSNKVQFYKKPIKSFLKNIKQYNCILLIDVMHHIDIKNQENTVVEILNNLNKDSIFIYKDISNRNFLFSLLNRIHDLLYNFQWINYYNSKKIISLAKQNKNNLHIKTFFHRILFYDHEFIIIKRNN